MPTDKRTFIVSNLHRDEINDLNNDVTITLPDNIFSEKVESINMKYMHIEYSTETIGSSNREFYVTYPETSIPTRVTLDIDKTNSTIVKTDTDLAQLIPSSINSTLGTIVFQTFFDQIVISNQDVYRDNSDLLSAYTIFTNNGANFKLDFESKQSLGPLIGFGNESFQGSSSYRGGNIPPIYAYESIHVSNKAYDPIFKEYDRDTDIACKMNFYDSNDELIPNYLDPRDATISLPIANGYITNTHMTIFLDQLKINFTNDTERYEAIVRSYLQSISPSTDEPFDFSNYLKKAPKRAEPVTTTWIDEHMPIVSSKSMSVYIDSRVRNVDSFAAFITDFGFTLVPRQTRSEIGDGRIQARVLPSQITYTSSVPKYLPDLALPFHNSASIMNVANLIS